MPRGHQGRFKPNWGKIIGYLFFSIGAVALLAYSVANNTCEQEDLVTEHEINQVGVEEGKADARAISIEIFNLINEKREEQGLSKLEWDEELATLAVKHSEYMESTSKFEHSDYPSLGYHYRENLYYFPGLLYRRMNDSDITQTIVQGWYDSFLHNQAMMDESISYGAVGIVESYVTFLAR